MTASPEGAAGRTIRVEVTLKGSLATWLPGGRGPVELPAGATVNDLRMSLSIPDFHCLYVVNGSAVTRDTVLHDDDRLQILPPMAGGQRPRG